VGKVDTLCHPTNGIRNQDVCLGASGRETASTASLAWRRLLLTLPWRIRNSVWLLSIVPEISVCDYDYTSNHQTGTVFEHSAVGLRKWSLAVYTYIRFNTSLIVFNSLLHDYEINSDLSNSGH